jgi:hypothetical protein
VRRREFVAGFGAAAAWPVVARAQRDERPRLVGILMNTTKDDPDSVAEVDALRGALEWRRNWSG